MSYPQERRSPREAGNVAQAGGLGAVGSSTTRNRPGQDEINARRARALSAFRLSAGVLKSDAERLTWIAYEISKHCEVAGLQSLSDEAAQIALRAFDAAEVLA